MPFRFANVAGRAALVDSDGGWYDLERLTAGAIASDPMTAIAAGADALSEAATHLGSATPDGALTDAELRAPAPRPMNSFGVGLNYATHAAESNIALPEQPVVFTKYPGCIVGPNADVELATEFGDYEVELVAVIGSTARNVSTDQAWSHVLGLTVGQDISDRKLQVAASPPHFGLGKSRDTYGPLGPMLVSVDSFDDPDDIALTCDVNGDRRQEDSTKSLVFDVPFLVSYLSNILTLHPGDVIFTGTPAGVGAATKTFLKPGDEIVSTIAGVGTMTNRCI